MRNIKLRFSLASLLVVVTVAAIWFAKISNDARKRETAIESLESSEAVVEFEKYAHAPEWLRDAVGQEYH